MRSASSPTSLEEFLSLELFSQLEELTEQFNLRTVQSDFVIYVTLLTYPMLIEIPLWRLDWSFLI